jgi:hypothetical protein
MQRSKQRLEALDFHGVFGGSQPPDGAAGRERQAEATAVAAESPAFDCYHVDRQMADMVTAGEVALEGVKLLTVCYQARGGGLHCFLVSNNRIAMFLAHRLSPGSLGLVPFRGGEEVMPLRGVQ